jgi:hypothetical protein
MRKKFNHLGIPTTETKEGEIYLPHLKMKVADYERACIKHNGCVFKKMLFILNGCHQFLL